MTEGVIQFKVFLPFSDGSGRSGGYPPEHLPRPLASDLDMELASGPLLDAQGK